MYGIIVLMDLISPITFIYFPIMAKTLTDIEVSELRAQLKRTYEEIRNELQEFYAGVESFQTELMVLTTDCLKDRIDDNRFIEMSLIESKLFAVREFPKLIKQLRALNQINFERLSTNNDQ